MGLALFLRRTEMLGQLIDGQYYLTATETARRVGVSDETIRRWVRLGKLPARKLGLQYFILVKDVERYIRIWKGLAKEKVKSP